GEREGQARGGCLGACGAEERVGNGFGAAIRRRYGASHRARFTTRQPDRFRIPSRVKYFDAFIGGSGAYESLVYDGMVEPLAPNLILPEVREEKYWWGGHIWEDNVKTKRFLYSFIADAGAGGFWYNTEVAKPE